ncbi:GPI alpha-1,2-mannosyltransferase 4 [Carettochelys insculpta]|uniref:GPI alpha-1,2-mannosyltransferase 4 n=1 Tax=Carettochelys insculpta TaxID=44489 RepID=UPI003EBB7E83
MMWEGQILGAGGSRAFPSRKTAFARKDKGLPGTLALSVSLTALLSIRSLFTWTQEGRSLLPAAPNWLSGSKLLIPWQLVFLIVQVCDFAQTSFSSGKWHECRMSAKTSWRILALLRIFWCLLPQTGYLHPDEFFQSPEVMAGDILDLQVYYPWEFLSSYPCRTVVFPLITSGITYWMIKSLKQLGIWSNGINSYTLLVSPRLLLTIFSFILDYSVYRIAPFWGAEPWNALILLAGSYVTLIFYTRTFSNTVEGLLFALLMVLISPKAVGYGTAPKTDIDQAKSNSSGLIGIITVAGFFNRPTFLAFALMPLLYWTVLNATSRHNIKTIANHLWKFVSSTFFTAIIFTAADSLYFTAIGSDISLYSIKKNGLLGTIAQINENVTVTPFNFLRYNLSPHNLAQHGIHPRCTHFAVNGLILFGILHILAISVGLKMLKINIQQLWIRLHSHRPSTMLVFAEGNPILLSFYFVPLAFLSLFNHQEPRFLIPLILPLVLLITSQNRALKWKHIIIVFNVFGALLFGCLHQGGLIPCLSHLEQLIHSPDSLKSPAHYTLFFAHTYMPPRFLLSISKRDPIVEIIDVAGTEEKILCQTLGQLVNISCGSSRTDRERMCHFFVITPGTVRTTIQKCGVLFKNETLIFPHLTMEDPPQISFLFSEKWRSQLGLYILQVDRSEQNLSSFM